MNLSETKKQLRSQLIKQRGLLLETYCLVADRAITARVMALPGYRQADVIFCFVSTENEISTIPIFHDAWAGNKRIGVPLCTEKGIMEVREIKSFADLQPGLYGIKEPVPETALIRPEEIDFAVVPCLSCSCDGRRLGYGGGYYDRYLGEDNGVRAVKAVICREQMICNEIPAEPHDIIMDLVITEKGIVNES